MKSIADFEFNGAPLLSGIMLVLKTVRPDFDREKAEAHINELIRQTRKPLPPYSDEHTCLQTLITLFYHKWQFSGASGVYSLSDTLWLDNVLRTQRGSPVSLGILFLHIAQAIGLPVVPVVFPTQLILRADLDDETLFINPINGDLLDQHTLDVWIKGTVSPAHHLTGDDLEEAENSHVVRKYLDSIKVALMEEKKMEQALKVSETILLFDPDDPYEIRDRGLIYAQLDCSHIAVSDLNYFIEQCPQDPVSEMIKMQIHTYEQQHIVLH